MWSMCRGGVTISATSILINIGAQTAGAVKGIGDVNKALAGQEKAVSKSGAAVKKMAVPAAAAFTAVAGAAMGFAKAAVEDAKSAERMANNLAKSTGATEAQVAATEDWISAQGRALGVADDELRPAIERLARSTGDLGEAQDMASLAMDISAATGKDVVTVSNALAKANEGQMGALEKLGITMGDQALNTIEYNKAQAALAKNQGAAQAALKEYGPASKVYATAAAKVATSQEMVNVAAQAGIDWVGELGTQFGGAAAANADTAAGKMQRFQLTLSELGESIGAALLPALSALMVPLQAFASWASENTTLVTVIGAAIGGLAAAILVANAAMAAWSAIVAIWSAVTAVATAVGAAFGAVMAVITSPITLIILAIVALIAIVVLLWKNWDTVTKALGKAWAWLKDKAVAIFNALKTFLAGVWTGIRNAVTTAWNGIKSWLAGIWTGIKTTAVAAFNALKSKLSEIWTNIKDGISNKITALLDKVEELPGKILSAISGFGTLLYDAGKSLIQGLINGIKSMAGAILEAIKGLIPNWAKKIIPGMSAASMSAVSPAGAAFMTPTPTTATPTATREQTVIVTEEQVYRAVQRLLLKGQARNGKLVMVG